MRSSASERVIPYKCDETENHVGQQEHPGIAALVNGVICEQRIKRSVNRTEIVPPDFVTEHFGSRLSGSAYEEIHKSDGR